MGGNGKGGGFWNALSAVAAAVTLVSTALLSGFVASISTVQLMTVPANAGTVDYVHDDVAAAAATDALPGTYHAGYPYHFTDSEYFASRDWHSSPWHGDEVDGMPAANEDGSLGEFRPGWYAAHSDTGYGQEILEMGVGDRVSIDGVAYEVEGTMLIYAGGGHTASEVLARTGDADVILQTCTEDGYGPDGAKRMVAVWGRKVVG